MTEEKQIAAISMHDKAYSRTCIRIQMAFNVRDLWNRISREQNLDIGWLAARLGKDVKYVKQKLKGPGDWTLNNIADFLAAMDARITNIEILTYSEIEQQNKTLAGDI